MQPVSVQSKKCNIITTGPWHQLIFFLVLLVWCTLFLFFQSDTIVIWTDNLCHSSVVAAADIFGCKGLFCRICKCTLCISVFTVYFCSCRNDRQFCKWKIYFPAAKLPPVFVTGVPSVHDCKWADDEVVIIVLQFCFVFVVADLLQGLQVLKACSLVAAELVLLLQKFKKEKDEEEKRKEKEIHIFAAALVNLSLQSTCSQLQAHS